MTSRDSQDTSAESLKALMRLAPDPDRAERVRVRCRQQLERGRRRASRAAAIAGFAWQVLAPAFVGGFCVVYVVMLVATTLRLH
jgi:hypothetical protein